MTKYLLLLCLSRFWFVDSSCAETRIFQDNEVNTMTADALAPFVTRTSVTMVLNVWLTEPFFLIRKDFNYFCHMSSFVYFYVFSGKFSTTRVNHFVTQIFTDIKELANFGTKFEMIGISKWSRWLLAGCRAFIFHQECHSTGQRTAMAVQKSKGGHLYKTESTHNKLGPGIPGVPLLQPAHSTCI